MAPPVNRRSGFSRRAQYSTFIGYAAGVLGALLGVVLLVLAFTQPDIFSGLRAKAGDIQQPGAEATAAGRSFGKSAFTTIAGFFESGSEHAKLKRELGIAKTRLVEARAIEAENRRLKAMLGVIDADGRAVAVTRIVSSTASSTRRFATIGAGRDRGVEKGMPVRSQLGLVGRVLDVGANSARVLLITDSESLVPVRRATDGVPALAQGAGDGTVRIRLINLGINPLKVGDVMVTSGSGGLYRPNTPMVVLDKILRDGAIGRVLANPSDTDFALVEKTWAPEVPPPPATSGDAAP